MRFFTKCISYYTLLTFLEKINNSDNIKNTIFEVLKDKNINENAKKISNSFKTCGNAIETVKFIENKVKGN